MVTRDGQLRGRGSEEELQETVDDPGARCRRVQDKGVRHQEERGNCVVHPREQLLLPEGDQRDDGQELQNRRISVLRRNRGFSVQEVVDDPWVDSSEDRDNLSVHLLEEVQIQSHVRGLPGVKRKGSDSERGLRLLLRHLRQIICAGVKR